MAPLLLTVAHDRRPGEHQPRTTSVTSPDSGNPIERDGPEDADAPDTGSMELVEGDAAAVQRFRLRSLDGPTAGSCFDSRSDRLQIGSHPSNQVQIRERTVSRFHCEAFVEPSGRA